MYVLIRADVDHENETAVGMMAASDNLTEVQQLMKDEYEKEMSEPSFKWLKDEGWDLEYSGISAMHADCDIETAEWSVHWHIFDTDNMDWFTFI